jgi:NTE family protein
LAANLYDEILFNGATFADLGRLPGPAVVVNATEIATGSRVAFLLQDFDIMCTDRGTFRLARAAAAASAVPVVLSPITINNYGGSCGNREPAWLRQFAASAKPPRPTGRMLKRLKELRELDDGVEDPYFHLVDGAVSDNLGLRGVLDFLETFEALRAAGQPTPLDQVQRIIIFVVNAASSPSTTGNTSENPPGTLALLTKAAGIPIDRYANESVELLRDIDARWTALRAVRNSVAFAKDTDATLTSVVNAPNADIYVLAEFGQTSLAGVGRQQRVLGESRAYPACGAERCKRHGPVHTRPQHHPCQARGRQPARAAQSVYRLPLALGRCAGV